MPNSIPVFPGCERGRGLTANRIACNPTGERGWRTLVAVATLASAEMVGPPPRRSACCEFGGNSYRDSIWEIPLNSSRIRHRGSQETKPFTVDSREERGDGSLPHRPLR